MPGAEFNGASPLPTSRAEEINFITNTDVNYALLPCFSHGATREQRNSQIFSFIRHLSGSSTLAPSCTISIHFSNGDHNPRFVPDHCEFVMDMGPAGCPRRGAVGCGGDQTRTRFSTRRSWR